MKLKRGAASEYCGSISYDGRAAVVGIHVAYFLRHSIKLKVCSYKYRSLWYGKYI